MKYLVFLIFLILGLAFQILQYLGLGFEFLPGDLGDTRFNIYVLEHGKQFLTGQINEYWSAGFMYPEKEVISLSDNLLGTVPIFTFFRIIGLNIFDSFQFWMLTISILNYAAAFILLKYLTKNHIASALGAFVFAFSIGLAAQMNHAQMFPRFAIPLAFLFLFLWKDKRQVKYFLGALLALVFQFYCGIYLGFMLSVPFLILFVKILIGHKKQLLQDLESIKTRVFYLSAVFLNVGLLLLLFLPYLRRVQTSGGHSYKSIVDSIPTFFTHLTPSPGTLYYDGLVELTTKYPAFWDHRLFPGVLSFIIFLVFVGLLIRKRRFFQDDNQRTFMLLGGITFLLFLRVGDISFYFLIHHIPGFSAMRSLTRIINIEVLFYGASLAFFYVWIANKYKIPNWAGIIAFIVLLSIENHQDSSQTLRTEKNEMVKRQESIKHKFEHIQKGSVVTYEPEKIDEQVAHIQLDAMLGAQALELKTVNGYSGSAPKDFHLYWENPNEANRKFYFKRFKISEENIVVVK